MPLLFAFDYSPEIAQTSEIVYNRRGMSRSDYRCTEQSAEQRH